MGIGQKAVVAILLTVVLVPPLAGFYSYFSGIPLHLLASSKEAEKAPDTAAPASISLVSGQAHTLQVPEEVCAALGIRKGERDLVEVAKPPTTMRPLVLPGSTALDPEPSGPHPRSVRSGPRGQAGRGLGLQPQDRPN